MPLVGNDVVDFAAPGNVGKSGDSRFCRRVFTAEEQALIAGSTCPDELLWTIWAAKEAAYKAVSRDDPAVSSVPRCYQIIHGDGAQFISHGKINCAPSPWISTPRGELALWIDVTKERVHAVTAGSEADLDLLCRRVDRLDGAGDPATVVRENIIREIARCIGCSTGDLRVVKDPTGPGAPRVLLCGRLLTVWISLSHDGRFTAFAFVPVFEKTKRGGLFPMI